jgi:DNA-binding transcriptional MerR regulator
MLDAEDLAAAVRKLDKDAEVSKSTVHYYTQAGILPSAIGRGPHSYTPEHLARFRLARRLRRTGLGLGDIRQQVSSLGREELATALQDAPEKTKGRSAKVGNAKALQANPTAGDPLVAPALQALPGRLPRTIRFPEGYSLSCPPEASDQLIARLYSAIENLLRDEASPRYTRRGSTPATERGSRPK